MAEIRLKKIYYPPCYICGELVKGDNESYIQEEDEMVFCHAACCAAYNIHASPTSLCISCIWYQNHKIRKQGN